MKNFKQSVPAAVQTKLSDLSQAIYDNWDKIVTGNKRHETQGEVRADQIEGNYVSGWMPSQDGGFDVSCWYRSDVDSGYHFTTKQTDFVNEQSSDCWKAFLRDNSLDSDTTYDQLSDEQVDDLCNYEMDWFQDGALFSVQMFVEGFGTYDDGKHQQVTIRSSINYRDGEYGREKYAEDIKVIVLEIDEFLACEFSDIIDQIEV